MPMRLKSEKKRAAPEMDDGQQMGSEGRRHALLQGPVIARIMRRHAGAPHAEADVTRGLVASLQAQETRLAPLPPANAKHKGGARGELSLAPCLCPQGVHSPSGKGEDFHAEESDYGGFFFLTRLRLVFTIFVDRGGLLTPKVASKTFRRLGHVPSLLASEEKTFFRFFSSG